MPIGAPNLIAGIGTLTIDGNQMAVRANLTISPDPVVREGISGQDRVHGYREMPRVPFIEADISVQQTQVITGLLDEVEGASTVVAMLADGRTFQLNEAWYLGATEINTADGQYRAKFEGLTCVEILGAGV